MAGVLDFRHLACGHSTARPVAVVDVSTIHALVFPSYTIKSTLINSRYSHILAAVMCDSHGRADTRYGLHRVADEFCDNRHVPILLCSNTRTAL